MILEASSQALRLRGFDPEILAGLLSDTRLEHYILAAGGCDVEHQRWSCGNLSVDTGRYSFPVRIVGAFPRDRICIGYMRELSVPTWVNGFEADTATIEFYPAGSELNYRAGRRGRWVAIELSESELQAAALRHLGHELELPLREVVSFSVPGRLRRQLDQGIVRVMGQAWVSCAQLEDVHGRIVELLGHLKPNRTEQLMDRARARRRLLAAADEYLATNLGSGFSARRLARAVGVTERSLQRHLRVAYGVTPQHWARCHALHHVRRRLLAGDPSEVTVEGLARESGFRHMGRFSGYYAELFGELPSATLRRVPGAMAIRGLDLESPRDAGGTTDFLDEDG